MLVVPARGTRGYRPEVPDLRAPGHQRELTCASAQCRELTSAAAGPGACWMRLTGTGRTHLPSTAATASTRSATPPSRTPSPAHPNRPDSPGSGAQPHLKLAICSLFRTGHEPGCERPG